MIPSEPDGLAEPLTYSESIAEAAYQEAAKSSLKSSDTLSALIITTAFSVSTAYGAVLALVTPKDAQRPLVVAAPLICLGLAIVVSLVATMQDVSLEQRSMLADVLNVVRDAGRWKRRINVGAVGLLAVGMVYAGVVVASTYRSDDEADGRATVVLSARGQQLVEELCGRAPDRQLVGDLGERDERSVAIVVDAATCPAAPGTIILPTEAVAVISIG